MYHLLVRRRTRAVFEQLSRGAWGEVLGGLSDDVEHGFPGDHPLGGVRHSREAVARWFERLERLFPGHEFRVHRVSAAGWPWSTWVAVQWSARLTPAHGEPYVNEGAHWIQLRWGRVVAFHAYLDTQLVARACAHMAEHGVAEARAAPIEWASR